MGYSTTFKGELKFTTEPTAKQLAALKQMLGEDCRDHPEWGAKDLYYIDLAFLDDFSGLMWDGAEKTYDLDKTVNVVINVMRQQWPEFGLAGMLSAQGESFDDRWVLVIGENGFAEKRDVVITGQTVTCPHCETKFILEEAA